MENSPTVIRPPSPPPQQPPSTFFPSSSPPPPLSQPGNTTTNTTIMGSPQPSQSQIYPIGQNGSITIVTINPPPPPPPFPHSPRSVDLSPLEFILALMAVITIPAIVYAFFFSVKCPPWSSSSREDHHRRSSDELPGDHHGSSIGVIEIREPVSGLKYRKETHYKDIGNECPVCLSSFADGEDVKQLSGCKHSFHATCIDLWLNNHNNCPICRAVVAGKRPNSNRRPALGSSRESDHHHGLPDAAGLV